VIACVIACVRIACVRIACVRIACVRIACVRIACGQVTTCPYGNDLMARGVKIALIGKHIKDSCYIAGIKGISLDDR